MNPETIQLIEKFAAKLGTTADHLWAILIRQAYVAIITDCILIVGCVITFLLALRFVRRMTAKIEERDHDEPGYVIPWCLLFIGTGILTIWCVVGVCEIIQNSLNPEYYAFTKITQIVGK